jgi:hypothetical protein
MFSLMNLSLAVYLLVQPLYPYHHLLLRLQSPRPTRDRVRTVAGQAFAEVIAAHDAQCLLHGSSSSDGGAMDHLPHSLATILDLVSLNAYHSFPNPLSAWSLDSETSLALFNFGLISHLDPDRYLRAPRTYDLSKAPDSYHEACSRPDASVWREAMGCEMDSLNARHAFAPCDLPSTRHAIGVHWVYAYL